MSEATFGRPAPTFNLGNLLRLLALPLLGFAAFAIGMSFVPSNRISLLGIAIVTGVFVLAPVVLDRTRTPERRHVLLTFLSIGYFARFVLPTFLEYLGPDVYVREGTFASIRSLSPEDIARGQLVILAGYLALLLGYVLPIGRTASKLIPRMGREWSGEAALAVALLMIPLGWAVTLAGQLGWIPRWAGSGVLGTIGSGASFGIALLALCYLRYRSLASLALIGLLVPPTMALNFFTGSKALFLMPLAMLVAAQIVVSRRFRLWWFAAGFAVITLLYPVSETYREYKNPRRLSAIRVLRNPRPVLDLLARFVDASRAHEYLAAGVEATSTRLDMLGITSVIVRDAGKRVPFQHGWSLGYVVIAFVPRFLWPGKPEITIGQWVTDHFGSGPMIRSNTGPSWIGEFYFNFGWTGVLVGMAMLGIWLRFLQESFLGATATIPALLAGVVAIFAIVPNLEGTIVAPINSVVFGVAPIVLAHLVVRAVTTPRLPEPGMRSH